MVGVTTVVALALAAAQEPSIKILIRDLRSAHRPTMFTAIETLEKRGPAAAAAVPALVDLQRRAGWKAGEFVAACDALAAIGASAKAALPLLVRFQLDSNADMHVQGCIEDIGTAMGPAIVPEALAVTAREAKRAWTRYHDVPEAMFDEMAVARTAFGRPMVALGMTALPALEQGLRHRDPFVQAEAASWLGMIGPPAKDALPSLREARRRSRSTWTRSEIDAAIAQIEGRIPN